MHALELNHVTLQLQKFSLKDISLCLPEGFILGLLGKNGSGKTTLIHTILNQHPSYTGSILIRGVDAKLNQYQLRNDIGFVSEENQFFENATLVENADYFGPLYQNWDMDLFHNMLKQFELPPHSTYNNCSKGMKIKFQMAFAMAHHPKFYLLDEPTAGLDPVFRKDFLYLLQDIIATDNVSILISTQITSDLDKVADYIAFLENGTLKFFADRESMNLFPYKLDTLFDEEE